MIGLDKGRLGGGGRGGKISRKECLLAELAGTNRLDLVQLIFNCSLKTHNTKRPSGGCCSGTFSLLARKSDLDRRATPRAVLPFLMIGCEHHCCRRRIQRRAARNRPLRQFGGLNVVQQRGRPGGRGDTSLRAACLSETSCAETGRRDWRSSV
jgi:hypothetical protein